MRKISLLAMLLAALPAAAYDVNGVGLGARESEVKKRFPSIHCKELEWKSRAAERHRDGSRRIVRAVERDVGDELGADRDRAQAAEADRGIAQRARDLRAQPRLVAAFDPHPVDRIRLRQAGFLRRPGRLRALDRVDEQDPAAGLLGRAAREDELQVGARPGERFELVGGAPRAVYEHCGPDFGFRYLERHGVPPLWNAAR